jgi:hypothetical protein
MSLRDFHALAPALAARRIDFDSAEVVGGAAGGHFLIVTGEAPCANMRVELLPLIYIACPEWWEIEVAGTLPGGICLTALRPFTCVLPLAGVTGSRGIVVRGATRSREFEVPGGCGSGDDLG